MASWGFSSYMTELDPQGVPQITIAYPGYFSYRAADVPVPVASLRQGMDAMVPPLTDIPSVSEVRPATGSTVSGTQYLDAVTSDPVGVTGVQFRLTGGTFNNALVGTGTPTIYGWLAGWDTSTVPNGSYTLQSVATDAAGSTDYSPPVTVTVANGPTTSVLRPTAGSILSGAQVVDAAASDAAGVTGVQFQLTGGALNHSVIATGTPTIYGWLAAWDTTTVPNGIYTLQSFVTDADNLSTLSAGVSVTVSNPTVSTISPTSGPGSGGTRVVITGSGLTGATGVKFGTTPATSFTVNSATKVVAYAPAEAAGTVDVTVTVAGVTTAPVSGDRYTYWVPTVTSISPTGGSVSGGTKVTITGANLNGASTVRFGSVLASSFVVNSKTKITAYAPPQSAGTVGVSVTTPAGTSATISADSYTYR